MQLAAIIIIALVFLTYSLFSKRLDRTSLTAPMLFTGVGLLLSVFWPGLLGNNLGHGVVHTLAELTLIFVLFSDAARIDLQRLIQDHNLPQRLLLIGMPLTILFGTLAALALFDMLSIWEAALVAVILAPTDAALGQAVVSSEEVPVRIRQALSVESGLNDGIALPLVLVFVSLASMSANSSNVEYWLQFGALQVTLGPLVGVFVGYVGATSIDFVSRRDWMSSTFEGIAALGIALIAFAGAELVHGNGFIAAFAAGMTFGNRLAHPCEFLYEFAESEGQFFTLTTFLVFGALAVSLLDNQFHWSYVLYAVLSLTLLRMLPVAISLIGTGVSKMTGMFLGWFGPRGLASILFALLIIENSEIHHGEEIMGVVVITVLLSIVVHGASAAPWSHRYGNAVAKQGECEEAKPVSKAAN